MNSNLVNKNNKYDFYKKIELSENSRSILQKLKEVDLGATFTPDQDLVNKLKDIQAIDLTKVLHCFFMEMVEKNLIADPVVFLDRLSAIIPLKKLEDAVKEDVDDALKEAKKMFEEAELYFKMNAGKASPTLQARFSSILEGVISLLESLIATFGLGDFFKQAESPIQAEFKSQKIMMLLSLFSMMSTMMVSIVGAAAAGYVIGGFLLVMIALSIVWPLVKPRTTYLPANAENWTRQIQNGSFSSQGRKESLNEIANILKMKRHAILVGPSRVGKSLTAKSFAEAIQRGDYPELKGKTVFRINTTDLVEQTPSFLGGGNTILNEISNIMGRHRDDIILVLDEVHMACKNEAKIADQLKTFLDEGGEFSHVIGITTEEEYKKHVQNNGAFSLRFDKVDIKNTGQEETIKILGDTVLKSFSKPVIAEDALEEIYSNSGGDEALAQPSASLKLLKRCINRTEQTQKSSTEQKVIKVFNKIESLRSMMVATRSRKRTVFVEKKNGEKKQVNIREEITRLEKKLEVLQKQSSKEKKELEKLFESKALLDRVTKETYSSVKKVSNLVEESLTPRDEKELNRFLLLQEFLGRSIEAHLEKTSETLGVKVIIDKKLIKEMAEQIAKETIVK